MTGDEYMTLLLERQAAYEAEHPPVQTWIRPLLEWFIQPGDEDLFTPPTEAPAPKRTPRTKPMRAELEAKRDAITAKLATLTAKRDAAYPKDATTDMAAYGGVGMRQTGRQHAKRRAAMDRRLAEYVRLNTLIDGAEYRLARLGYQIARLA